MDNMEMMHGTEMWTSKKRNMWRKLMCLVDACRVILMDVHGNIGNNKPRLEEYDQHQWSFERQGNVW